ncbi:MAG: hypothetical protein Q9169_006648 [Polycauliona sp. 2 TL-2023]
MDVDNYYHNELSGMDWRWQDTNLAGRFPFHKAKQITLWLDVNTCQQPDHLFHHMVYICSLLRSKAKSLRYLSIEIWNSFASFDCLNSQCISWLDADSSHLAQSFDVTQTDTPVQLMHDVDATAVLTNRISFLLKPLELLGRVQACGFNLMDGLSMTPELGVIFSRYEESLTDKKPFRHEEIQWLWNRYLSIVRQHDKRQQQKAYREVENRETWLFDTHKRYKCKHHPCAQKKYRRHCGKDAQCDGCDKWHHFLKECRKCKMRACTSCMSELREQRPALEKAAKHETWLIATSEQYDCKHPARAGKRYRRRCGKDAKCEGCEREFHWLMQCRDCKMRACASCTSELRRKKRAEADLRKVEGVDDATSWDAWNEGNGALLGTEAF